MFEWRKIEISESDYVIGKYSMSLKGLVDKLCLIIKIPEMSLFQIIEKMKEENIRSCDPVLISTILEFKL